MFFYRSLRVGKNGRPFTMWKVRTLRDGADKSSFASEYTWYGRFLRKWRLDEIPQVWNMLNGSMTLVGPRPEEKRAIDLLPVHVQSKLLSVKPGLFGLSGIYFMDEEQMLKDSPDAAHDFWTKIKPMKTTLDFFYIDHKCFLLDIAIIWMAIKARILNK